MIFDQSAHLDWDWIRTFPQYYWYSYNGQGVQAILDQAITNLQTFNTPSNSPYYYTICEMGFFQKYIQENPNKVAAIQKQGNNFQIISGGITSPDCLVCSGEGFIRNYLVGHLWLSQELPFLKPKPHCWLPDDFGQGPELPALLTALGFVSVGFSRLPGTLSTCPRTKPQHELLQNGVDFIWQASDGSQVITHWMLGPPSGYGFGNDLSNGPYAINQFTAAYMPNDDKPPRYSAASKRAMYIPIDDDFTMPIQGLLNDVQQWNDNLVQQGANNSNVATVDGTFDQFIGKLNSEIGKLRVLAPYSGTPYWTGYYASRAELKILHYETVRALTAAEVFALLTQPSNPSLKNMLPATFWNDMAAAWSDFAPSTHHDYVCGTASDPVYATEQLPLLQAAAEAARRAARGRAQRACRHGAEQRGRRLALDPGGEPARLPAQRSCRDRQCGVSQRIVGCLRQRKHAGTTFVRGRHAVHGERAEHGLRQREPVDQPGLLIRSSGLDHASHHRQQRLCPGKRPAERDYQPGRELGHREPERHRQRRLQHLLSRHYGQRPRVLRGHRRHYQFGNEYPNDIPPKVFKVDPNAIFATSGPGLGALVLEAGPLRVRLRTTVLVTVGTGEQHYFTREYLLVAGEPFLRMTTTAQAPLGYSVMTRFPLAAPVAAITHGTAYHWTSVQPLAGYWGPPTFQAAHDFLIPQDANGVTLAAAYHAGMPAWAYDNDSALIGCLLRNSPASGGHGASGSDPAPHTQHYALRVPTGLNAPTTGQPLQEALSFNTPLQAVEIPPGHDFYQFTGMLPGSGNLAGVVSDGPAILTVAKPGSFTPTDLIFRLYQPTNQTNQTVQVQLGSNIKPASASLVPAVERPWTGTATPIQTTANGFTLTMNAAVATVQVTPSP